MIDVDELIQIQYINNNEKGIIIVNGYCMS